ncbi:bactofilin family protein [Nitrincola sp.]|uniref:bactofilin family protein n=1 Tax=Nitrincola sp. TaxID=1926584 RepID=UPI003A92F7AA
MGILKRHVPPKPGRATVSIIARGNRFSGDTRISGKMHVDGTFEGHIVAEDDVSIGIYGLITGRVRGTKIFVSGKLEGEVICDHLFIEPGGQVNARVCCADMKVDQGGVFVGERSLPEPTLGINTIELSDAPQNSEHNDILASLPERITLKKG